MSTIHGTYNTSMSDDRRASHVPPRTSCSHQQFHTRCRPLKRHHKLACARSLVAARAAAAVQQQQQQQQQQLTVLSSGVRVGWCQEWWWTCCTDVHGAPEATATGCTSATSVMQHLHHTRMSCCALRCALQCKIAMPVMPCLLLLHPAAAVPAGGGDPEAGPSQPQGSHQPTQGGGCTDCRVRRVHNVLCCGGKYSYAAML
jgi:hypothetical protein